MILGHTCDTQVKGRIEMRSLVFDSCSSFPLSLSLQSLPSFSALHSFIHSFFHSFLAPRVYVCVRVLDSDRGAGIDRVGSRSPSERRRIREYSIERVALEVA